MPLVFGLKDFIDIFLVALILFYCYRVMRESRSLNVFYGVLIFVVFWLFVSQILEMKLLGSIFDKLVSVGALALIILFQDEIRNFFFTIGTHRQVASLLKLFRSKKKTAEKAEKDKIMPIVMACMSMSKQKVGALIVLERGLPLNDIIRSGEVIDANINQRLIENIFFKNSPLHDGAMIVSRNKIKAAGCILPGLAQHGNPQRTRPAPPCRIRYRPRDRRIGGYRIGRDRQHIHCTQQRVQLATFRRRTGTLPDRRTIRKAEMHISPFIPAQSREII